MKRTSFTAALFFVTPVIKSADDSDGGDAIALRTRGGLWGKLRATRAVRARSSRDVISDRAAFERLRALVNQPPPIDYLTFEQRGLVTELANGTVTHVDMHGFRKRAGRSTRPP